MRNFKWALVASLAVATTGCVETVDANYPNGGGYGYADNGYANGYYAPAYYAPTYTANRVETYSAPRSYAPQAARDTRSAPAVQPQVQHQADRGNDHSNNGGHRNDPPAAAPASNAGDHGAQQSRRGDHNSQDRDGDGRPDHRG